MSELSCGTRFIGQNETLDQILNRNHKLKTGLNLTTLVTGNLVFIFIHMYAVHVLCTRVLVCIGSALCSARVELGGKYSL